MSGEHLREITLRGDTSFTVHTPIRGRAHPDTGIMSFTGGLKQRQIQRLLAHIGSEHRYIATLQPKYVIGRVRVEGGVQLACSAQALDGPIVVYTIDRQGVGQWLRKVNGKSFPLAA